MVVCKVVDEAAPLGLRIIAQLHAKLGTAEAARLVLADLALKKILIVSYCIKLLLWIENQNPDLSPR